MPRFRKKPVVVKAEQFFPDKKPWPAGVREALSDVCSDPQCGDSTWDHECDLGSPTGTYYIDALEGVGKVDAGNWIITGIKGEKYPCKPDIFEATYEPVDESAEADRATIARQAAEEIHGTKPTMSPEAEMWDFAVEADTPIIRAAIDKALQSKLPQIADLHAAGIDITGGEDSVTYVRKLRDGLQNSPDLLEACQALMFHFCGGPGPQVHSDASVMRLAQEAINAALAEKGTPMQEACQVADKIDRHIDTAYTEQAEREQDDEG